jgi:hypothetical protein
VKTAIGIVGLIVFIVCVIGLAAAITWLVVKLSPMRERKPDPPAA